MKKFLLVLFLVRSATLFSQTECNPSQQITTNPGAAVNTQRPNLVNHFDWTQPSFPLRAEQLTSTTITSPFYQGPWNSNVSNLVDSKDRLPVDGWELINADFGYYNDGTPASSKVIDPKLLLYNKYTGTFRLFFAKGHTSTNDYNFIKIVLKFSPPAGEYYFNTFELINNGGILKALDISDYKTNPVNFQFMQDFQQTPGNWVYTDFPMHYDPCTCLFKSKIKIEIRYLTNANVDLTGTFSGKLAAITNGSGSVTNPPGFMANFKDVTSAGQTISKAYKTIDDFYSDVKKVNDNYGALSDMKDALHKSDFLKSGFSAMPFLNVALGFLNFFTGGGNSSGPTQVALTPTSIDLSGKITGTISNDILNTDGIFVTPGSDPTGADDTKYPIYSQPMGVIVLTKTPKLKWYRSRIGDDISDCCFRVDNRNDLLFDRSSLPMFEYALNPASGLRVKEVEAAIMIESTKGYGGLTNGYNNRNTNPWGFQQTLFYDGEDATVSRYRSEYFPINCFAGKTLSFETRESSDPVETFVPGRILLKVKFNLEKVSGTGQNVLLIQTYDITPGIQYLSWDAIRNVQDPPDAISLDYNNKPEPDFNTCGNTGANSNFQPVTFARLTSICNSTSYINSHLNSRVAQAPSGISDNTISKKGIVYPNPGSETINLLTDAAISKSEISIFNSLGQKITDYTSSISKTSQGTKITCHINKLSKGIYFLTLQNNRKAPQTYKFFKN